MSFNQVNSSGGLERVAGLVNSEKINEMYEAFPSDASASNKLVTTDLVSVNNYVKHTNNTLSTVGWYKIAKLTPSNYGSSIIINLTSTYNYFHNTAITFVISIADTSANCVILSKAGYDAVFMKARVINDYVEVYYDAQGTTNSVDAIIMISECSAGQTQIENFVADSTATGGTEWALVNNIMVATKSDVSFCFATLVTNKQYTFNFNTPGISILEIIATGYSDVRVAGHWIVNCVGTFGPSCQVISGNDSSSIQSCTFSVSDTVLNMSFAEEPYSVLVKELARA